MKPVLICGAGLGGLLLARRLQKDAVPFELFERDSDPYARGQGYRIRISTDGLDALREVLTEEEFSEFLSGTSKTGGGGIHALDGITGEPPPDKEQRTPAPGPTGSNENKSKLGGDVLGVARGFLRGRLMEGFRDKIQFAKHVTGYEVMPQEDDSDTAEAAGVRAIFADGSRSREGSILVGADGSGSKVTRQLTQGKVRAYDTGARMIHGQAPAGAFAGLGEGVWFISDESTHPGSKLGLITNVKPGSLAVDNSEELGFVFVGSPGSFDAPGGDLSIVGKVAADLSRELTTDWHPKIRRVLTEQNDAEAAFLKMMTADPDGVPEWPNESRITLLGDAVHCMTPAGGVGANTALKDAALLGKMIAECKGRIDGVTQKYEDQMRIYASANVKMSFEAASARFNIKELK